MEKERGAKIIGVMALVVAVIGMSIGFAAFSRTLEISPSAEADLPNEGNLNIVFDKYDDENEIYISTDPSSSGAEGFAIKEQGKTSMFQNNSIGDTANPLISGLKAKFTAKGQTVKFQFYIKNDGDYVAYRNAVNFANNIDCNCKSEIEGETCTSDQTILVTNTCSDISMTIKFGNTSDNSARGSYTVKKDQITNSGEIDANNSLTKNEKELVTIEVTYTGDSVLPINDFEVSLPTISLIYSSVN